MVTQQSLPGFPERGGPPGAGAQSLVNTDGGILWVHYGWNVPDPIDPPHHWSAVTFTSRTTWRMFVSD